MPVEIKRNGDTVTALISGEIDHHSAARLREKIDDSAERMRPKLLRLDFSGVTFMDSSGVGLIMGRYRLMSESGGRVSVCGASPMNARMLKLAGLGRLGIDGI